MTDFSKHIIKAGVISGTVAALIFFGFKFWWGNAFINSVFQGLIMGLVIGILNSVLLLKYAVPRHLLESLSVNLDYSEKIMYQSPARINKQGGHLIGKLFLTGKRLIFINYRYNDEHSNFDIKIEDIRSVVKSKKGTLFSPKLAIQTISGKTYTLTIDRVKELLNDIHKIQNGLKQGPPHTSIL